MNHLIDQFDALQSKHPQHILVTSQAEGRKQPHLLQAVVFSQKAEIAKLIVNKKENISVTFTLSQKPSIEDDLAQPLEGLVRLAREMVSTCPWPQGQ